MGVQHVTFIQQSRNVPCIKTLRGQFRLKVLKKLKNESSLRIIALIFLFYFFVPFYNNNNMISEKQRSGIIFSELPHEMDYLRYRSSLRPKQNVTRLVN